MGRTNQKILEVSNFLVLWNRLIHLSEKNLKIENPSRIAKIILSEYLKRPKTERSLGDRFEPSLSFSKSKTHSFRIAYSCINKKDSRIIKEIFSLYKTELGLSLDAVDLIIDRFLQLSPHVAFGLDGDTPRFKIYSQLESCANNTTVRKKIIRAILSIGCFLNIRVCANDINACLGNTGVFNNVCIDFYPDKKYAMKVYIGVSKEHVHNELSGLIKDYGVSTELIDTANEQLFCYEFSNKHPNGSLKSMYLKFDRRASGFDFPSVCKFLKQKDRAALRGFIDLNTITHEPDISYLTFSKNMFTVYFRPVLI